MENENIHNFTDLTWSDLNFILSDLIIYLNNAGVNWFQEYSLWNIGISDNKYLFYYCIP